MEPSFPGQNGQGTDVSACTADTLGENTNAEGRRARSTLTTTHRPVKGSRRSWFIFRSQGRSCAMPGIFPEAPLFPSRGLFAVPCLGSLFPPVLPSPAGVVVDLGVIPLLSTPT